MKTQTKIWFISEVYHPDEQGTAFYTTGLAEGLAEHFPVGVLCSYPTVTARGARVARKEVRNGVVVERCRGTTFNKDILVLRVVNLLTYSIALFCAALARVGRGDVVIAVTSPPSAPFIAKLVCSLRRARCILRLEDVYPDVLAAVGILGKKSFAFRCIEFINRSLYRHADRIVVLGRDMKRLAEMKTGGRTGHIRIIRSWSDTDVISPSSRESNLLLTELGLSGKFIVSCIGNIGRAQAVEVILEAVTHLQHDQDIHFLFIGSGAKREWLKAEASSRGLSNITVLDQRPRNDQANFLNACDISIVSMVPGMTGVGVPSRTYNIMAAGKAIIALTGEESEVSLLVREEDIGWVVPPDNAEKLVKAILHARSEPATLQWMGQRAAAAAREKFSRKKIIEEYHEMVNKLCPQLHHSQF